MTNGGNGGVFGLLLWEEGEEEEEEGLVKDVFGWRVLVEVTGGSTGVLKYIKRFLKASVRI